MIAFELAIRRGNLVIVPWGALLLAWGYLQYRLIGDYRVRRGGGGPGITVPPKHLVTNGIYAYTRNPMYLAHLIFLLGLAVTFWSWLALILFAVNAIWFHRRALDDEARLRALFGAQYRGLPGTRETLDSGRAVTTSPACTDRREQNYFGRFFM